MEKTKLTSKAITCPLLGIIDAKLEMQKSIIYSKNSLRNMSVKKNCLNAVTNMTLISMRV